LSGYCASVGQGLWNSIDTTSANPIRYCPPTPPKSTTYPTFASMNRQKSISYFKDIAALLEALRTVTPQSNLFHIHRHEDVPATHTTETQLFRSDTFSASLLTSGEAEYKIGLQDYQMKAGSFYFMSPQQLRYYKKTKPWKGYVLLFSTEFMLQYSKANIYHEYPFFQLDANVRLHLSKQQLLDATGILEKMHQLYNSGETDKFKFIYHYLSLLLLQAKKWHAQQHDGVKELNQLVSLAKAFDELLEKHFFEIVTQQAEKLLTVSDFANKLNVSTNYLSDSIKKETGKTPTQIIKERTILEAKSLLHNTELTVSEVAYFLTFEDPSYFAKYFKSATGISPSDFKSNKHAK
jgi:AraC family transcriptional regulator, transcriptional activator of pobA